MKINADFDKRALVHSADMPWIDSPMPGVSRRPLDRVGAEIARATSIVRYAPGSKFSPHVHTGGEEFLVLDGVFQDEHGDFPAGSYIRNPPQSSHTPGSEPGCVIFVKLWQFDMADRQHLRLNIDSDELATRQQEPGVQLTSLYADKFEEVTIQTLNANSSVRIDAKGGLECLVLTGQIQQQGDLLKQHSWLRLPIGSVFEAKAGEQGAKLWVKRNHLAQVEQQIERVSLSS